MPSAVDVLVVVAGLQECKDAQANDDDGSAGEDEEQPTPLGGWITLATFIPAP